MHSIVSMLPGTPFLMKSSVVRYCTPISSSIMMAFMLGKPDTGRPIAAEHTSAEP